MPVLVWMITFGSWNLLQSGFFSDFYDAQARALFHGHWNVPPSVVQLEGFVVKGRTYLYYGPFPALIRMPILLVTSSLDGRLTQLSILLAMLVALICTSRLAWKIRNLVSSASVSFREAALVAFSVTVVGIGSVFVFLANTAIVYHEAEAWGAALAIAAFDAMVCFLENPSRRGIAITGVLATLDLLTRAGPSGSAPSPDWAFWPSATGRCRSPIGACSPGVPTGGPWSPRRRVGTPTGDWHGSASPMPVPLARAPWRWREPPWPRSGCTPW